MEKHTQGHTEPPEHHTGSSIRYTDTHQNYSHMGTNKTKKKTYSKKTQPDTVDTKVVGHLRGMMQPSLFRRRKIRYRLVRDMPQDPCEN